MPEFENTPPSDRLPISDTQSNTNGINSNQTQVDGVLGGPAYAGSMQDILSKNTGKRVIIDFLVGTTNIVRKEGILYLVGVSYVVLYDNRADTYTVCNLYSIVFVTFLPSELTPRAATALKRV